MTAGPTPPEGSLPLRRPLAWELAWRFLRGQRSRLLSGTARVAFAATALGVTALIIAMALMTGYQAELERKLSGGGGAVLAIPVGLGSDEAPAATVEALRGLPEVARVQAVVLGQGVLTSSANPEGLEVTVRGIDASSPGRGSPGDGAGPLGATEEQLAVAEDGLPGAVLGVELAKVLGVAPGDVLRLVAVGFSDGRPRFRYQSVRCTGTFASGLAEFDGAWLLIRRPLAVRLFGPDRGAAMYEIEPRSLEQAGEVATAVEKVLDQGYMVTNWLELNRPLFNALRLQKLFLFLVLGLIVVVSTFHVASTLMVAVRERMRDLGVLQALGLQRRVLWRSFVLYGGLLGALGVAAGVLVGCAAAWFLDTFEVIRFDAEVAAIYFINAVRFEVRLTDVLLIVTFALAVNLVTCAFPAWRATRIDPTQALRYE
ncbi:MAG: FtsX-like permease family protein [Acidobacteriota bacterium]|nr:FtsX-like permease family protein [Acidobacteriota bacterium]